MQPAHLILRVVPLQEANPGFRRVEQAPGSHPWGVGRPLPLDSLQALDVGGEARANALEIERGPKKINDAVSLMFFIS